MGSSSRAKPARLAEKLKTVRMNLDLTMEEMVRALDCPAIPLYRASIKQYEKDNREPPLPVLLRYARLAGITVDVLIDDDLDLPERKGR